MEKILGWVFKDYKLRLEKDYEHKVQLFKASVDMQDVLRERLKGVRPMHPDDNATWLRDKVASMESTERLDFLSKAHAVHTNKVFKEVILFLLTESMRKTTLEAADIIEVNFNRATINGLQLLEEEIETFSTMYIEEKKLQEIMTTQESHEPI